MSREVDVRSYSTSRATPRRMATMRAAATASSEKLRGIHSVEIDRFNATTGGAAVVSSRSAPADPGNFVQRALDHVQTIGGALGLMATQAAEFSADPKVQTTSSDASAVNLQQRYKGLPIFQSAVKVRFAPDGSIVDTIGSTIGVAEDAPIEPALTVQEAVVSAARHVAQPDPDDDGQTDQFGEPLSPPRVDVSGFEPKVRAMFEGVPERSTVLEPGPFGAEIKAGLLWFPLDDRLALAWSVLLTMPEYRGQYHTIVDAGSGRILFCHQMIDTVAATANVFTKDGSAARVSLGLPRGINDYALPLPAQAQSDWRWCSKCQGLFFGGNPGSKCPAGGAHTKVGSGNYLLVNNSASYPGQSDWRWCSKCQGLFFGGNPGSKCPAGGAHTKVGSGNYSLLRHPLSPGQHGWRWCNKCQGLFFSGNPGPKCPAGAAHDATGSADYALVSTATGLPAGFPDTWVAVDSTVGNCTNAHLGSAGAPFKGTVAGGTITFNPASGTADDQKVLNIFYYCCYMHDYFYLLGFREGDGNFQHDNFARGGAGSDRVDARSHSGAVFGTANMSTPVDGSGPVMNMGLVTASNRHTAMDSSVVYHEFMHGVTNRLVGGAMNVHALDAPQSGGMGEGWGDYVACTINDTTVVGSWVVNDAAGIRGFPYDSNFPDKFDKMGTGRYTQVHNIGEIWCATLMEMNRRTEKNLAMQLVVDALKLSPANPSFLDMRDAIFAALTAMRTAGRLGTSQYEGTWQGIWSAFTKFGMGPQAASNGAQLTGIVGDFSLGQTNWRWCSKCQGLFFGGNPGSKCPAGGAHTKVGSGNYDIVHNAPASYPGQSNWRWCNKCQGMFFGGNPGSKCPAGGAHVKTGSGDYKLIFNAAGSPAQYGWRWCNKCQGLFFSGNPGSKCPAGAAHVTAGSGDYSLSFT
jgi:hypothetical protein